MKCRKCNQAAVVNMRQHKLALCEAHYLEWLPAQTQRTIEKYHMFTRDDKILVAVSGGKDSLSVWNILLQLGYQADGMTLQLGIDEGIHYSDQSHAYIEKFVHDFYPQAVLHTIDVKATYGASLPEIAARHDRAGERPCAVCGLIKRHEMNRIAYELGYHVLDLMHAIHEASAAGQHMEMSSTCERPAPLPAGGKPE